MLWIAKENNVKNMFLHK